MKIFLLLLSVCCLAVQAELPEAMTVHDGDLLHPVDSKTLTEHVSALVEAPYSKIDGRVTSLNLISFSVVLLTTKEIVEYALIEVRTISSGPPFGDKIEEGRYLVLLSRMKYVRPESWSLCSVLVEKEGSSYAVIPLGIRALYSAGEIATLLKKWGSLGYRGGAGQVEGDQVIHLTVFVDAWKRLTGESYKGIF